MPSSPASDRPALVQFFPFTRATWHPRGERIRRLLRIAFFAAVGLVAALSLAPSATLPSTSLGDKVEHVIAYAALGLLGVAQSPRRVTRAAAWRVILGLTLFGIAIELLQSFSPGRSPGALDAVADIAGAGAGCGAAVLLRHMTRLLIDKRAPGATPCRARVAGSDVRPRSDSPAAAPSSPHKRASCVSH